MSQQEARKDAAYEKGREQAAEAIDATKEAAQNAKDKAQGMSSTRVFLSILSHFLLQKWSSKEKK